MADFTVELSVDEKITLSRLEERIDRGLKGFVEAGQALAAIRDRRLYRTSHSSFEDYCRDRWQISRPRAYELIGAAEVVEILSGLPETRLPENMRQAEPLLKLRQQPDELRQVWSEVTATAPAKLTAAHVEAVVERSRPLPPPAVGQHAIVTDPEHQDFGQQIKITQTEGKAILHCERPDGSSGVFLVGEVRSLTPEQRIEQLAGLIRETLEAMSDSLPSGLKLRLQRAI